MDTLELLEELELRFPEKIAEIELNHGDLLEQLDRDGQAEDPEALGDLEEELRDILRI